MYHITLIDIAMAFAPVLITLTIIWRWSDNPKSALIAIVRMLIQLMLIGYALNFIFSADSQWIILLVLMFMLVAASWIGLNTLPVDPKSLFIYSFVAILCGGGLTLAFISQWVLHADPWYQPQVIIPIAGMIFSNAMNAISLAGERLYSELGHHQDYARARNTAFQAAMIPVTNALLAVGLVSLPGMMTGQILAGISPLIASRYQIIVMCMIFSSAGISTAIFLTLLKRRTADRGQ
jgi:putative ABC transport system permease protein